MQARALAGTVTVVAALAFAGAASAATGKPNPSWDYTQAKPGAYWDNGHARPNPMFCERFGLRPLRAAQPSMSTWD